MASSTDQFIAIVNRLLDDQDLHEHISSALSNAAAVRERIGSRGSKAAEEKRTYAQLREAIRSALQAARIIEAPPPPKRRRLPAPVVLIAGMAAAALVAQRVAQAEKRSAPPPAGT